jgi:hypothetical protein
MRVKIMTINTIVPYGSNAGFPVTLKNILSPRTIAFGEKKPFVFFIENVSYDDLGTFSDDGNAVTIKVTVAERGVFGGGAALFSSPYCRTRDLCINHSFEWISPGEGIQFSGVLEISELTRYFAFETASIMTTLCVETHESIERCEFEFEMQVTPHYVSPPEDDPYDVLLVINSETTYQEVSSWKLLLREIGLGSVGILNMSLYGGLNMHQRMPDGNRLVDDLENKTVVILNNSYANDYGDKCQPSDQVSLSDIFQSAHDADINTYFVGGDHINMSHYLIPVEGRSPDEHDILKIVKRYLSPHEPTEKDMIEAAENVNRELMKKYPSRCHLVVYDYDPQMISDHELWRKYFLGTVEVYSSLMKSEASISSLLLDEGGIHRVERFKRFHKFNILKLENFDEKLKLISSNMMTESSRSLLAKAILSDIICEQVTYRDESWDIDLHKKAIKGAIGKLQQLCVYVSNGDEKKFAVKLFLNMRFFLLKIQDDPLLNRNSEITKLSKQKVSATLKKLKKIVGRDWYKRAEEEITDNLSDLGIQEMIDLFLNPLGTRYKVLQDNNLEVTEKVMSQSEFLEIQNQSQKINMQF